MIITISRQFAAGGSDVARRVAERLGWTLVDNELVERVSQRAGLSEAEVAEREERAPGFAERVARALAASVPEFVTPDVSSFEDLPESDLVSVTERVVAELASEGQVVMVGRAAPAVLASHPDALHVRLVAPEGFRVRRAMERFEVDEETARHRLHESDAARARYHRQHYDRDWSDPLNYHMTLNTAALTLEGAAHLIVARALAIWPGGR